MFDNINNNNKKKTIYKFTRIVKIQQFYKLVYNQIIYLNILI